MRLLRLVVAAAVAGAVLSAPAFAQKAPTASKSQEYHVIFAFPSDRTYTGSMTLEIQKGKVTGKMGIDSPQTITGTVAGTLKGDALSLDYPFEVAGDQPCTGRVTVAATFNAARTEARGTTHAEGCGDPQDGQFTMTNAGQKGK
jgi:hypothetical protein